MIAAQMFCVPDKNRVNIAWTVPSHAILSTCSKKAFRGSETVDWLIEQRAYATKKECAEFLHRLIQHGSKQMNNG